MEEEDGEQSGKWNDFDDENKRRRRGGDSTGGDDSRDGRRRRRRRRSFGQDEEEEEEEREEWYFKTPSAVTNSRRNRTKDTLFGWEKDVGASGLRINFKFDGIDGSNDSDSGAIETLYRNVDVLPIVRMIYDSIANDENLCVRNVIPVLRDSPYWDGERREERGDASTITEERSRTKRFNNVCVGGTFDHAHAGHRLLLACAVAVTERRLDVGITSEALLANKKYKDYLQTYSEREQFCKDFIKASAPVGLSVNFGPLDENWPIAATREDVDALVVSEETVEGGLKINEERVKRGFGELELVVVDVLGKKENSSSSKLSSTRLRELEAERQT